MRALDTDYIVLSILKDKGPDIVVEFASFILLYCSSFSCSYKIITFLTETNSENTKEAKDPIICNIDNSYNRIPIAASVYTETNPENTKEAKDFIIYNIKNSYNRIEARVYNDEDKKETQTPKYWSYNLNVEIESHIGTLSLLGGPNPKCDCYVSFDLRSFSEASNRSYKEKINDQLRLIDPGSKAYTLYKVLNRGEVLCVYVKFSRISRALKKYLKRLNENNEELINSKCNDMYFLLLWHWQDKAPFCFVSNEEAVKITKSKPILKKIKARDNKNVMIITSKSLKIYHNNSSPSITLEVFKYKNNQTHFIGDMTISTKEYKIQVHTGPTYHQKRSRYKNYFNKVNPFDILTPTIYGLFERVLKNALKWVNELQNDAADITVDFLLPIIVEYAISDSLTLDSLSNFLTPPDAKCKITVTQKASSDNKSIPNSLTPNT